MKENDLPPDANAPTAAHLQTLVYLSANVHTRAAYAPVHVSGLTAG